MATRQTRALAKAAVAPSVLVLFVWMIVPLGLTLYFSVLHYNLLDPGNESFIGFLNYQYFLTDPAFFTALVNTLKLVGGVLVITVVGGILLALLLDQPIFGRGIVRLMVIAPFFVMPTVSALIWKNLLMHPVSGLFAWLAKAGRPAADRLVRRSAADRDLPHRRLAVAALRHAHPADGPAVARPGAEGGGRDGRHAGDPVLLLYRAAAHRPRRHRRHPDRDDLPAERLRGDPRHHRRRRTRRPTSRSWSMPRPCCSSTSAVLRPAASSR